MQDNNKYLTFKINNESFATPLLEIREVVEYQQPKPITKNDNSFLGIINIRGQIVGVVDLKKILGSSYIADKKSALLIYECRSGIMAGIIDSIESVTIIEEEKIFDRENFRDKGDDSFLGITEINSSLVKIVSIGKILESRSLI